MQKILPLFLTFLLYACSSGDMAGTATDTENTVAGVLYVSTSSAARFANASLIAEADNFGSSARIYSVKSDSNGVFYFDSIACDTFNLLVSLEDSSEMAFKKNLTAENLKDSLTITLETSAYLTGVFDYAEYLDEVSVGSGFKLSVLGTGIELPVIAGDSFSLTLPAGEFRMAFSPNNESIVQRLRELGFADSLIYQDFFVTLTAGDTLRLGNIHWTLGEVLVNTWEQGSLISGYVTNEKGRPVSFAAVSVITDIYGFEFAKGNLTSGAENTVYTNSDGYFELPFPTATLYDSLRVEAVYSDGRIAESRFIQKKELDIESGDTIFLDTLTLTEPAAIDLEMRLVINKDDTTQNENCLMNGVVVGLVGTSKFEKMVTCDTLLLDGLPVGEQRLVFYTSDMTVLSVLWERSVPLESYASFVSFVGLAPKDLLENQVVTYTPPTL